VARGGAKDVLRHPPVSDVKTPKERPGTPEGASMEHPGRAPVKQRTCREGRVEATKESGRGVDDRL
jgi:hypothetical protein